jgi:SAM-dependent methyltransferase
MLEVARRKLRDAPVTFDTLDAHALPFADEHFDAVICQLGLMLFSDPPRALAEFRRVLRPDGRVAVSVSTRPERTLYLRVSAAIARHVPSKASTLNRCFDIADAGRLSALLADAAFRDIQVESECRELRFASFDTYFGDIENGATLSGQEYVCLPDNVRQRVRADVRRDLLAEGPDGPLTIHMEVLIGSGRR